MARSSGWIFFRSSTLLSKAGSSFAASFGPRQFLPDVPGKVFVGGFEDPGRGVQVGEACS